MTILTNVKRDVTSRLNEVFQLVEKIRKEEATPPEPDSTETKILRGLFYVHLYAALEYSVNRGVENFLQELDALSIAPIHLELPLLSIALDPTFAAIRNVGEDKRWTRRVELLKLQTSNTPQKINSSLLGLYLQNIWIERLETLFSCLAINAPVVPDQSYRLYVDELVERRNGVAHGRLSALDVGSARRHSELLIRYNAISATCFYILDCLETQYADRKIITTTHRSTYL